MGRIWTVVRYPHFTAIHFQSEAEHPFGLLRAIATAKAMARREANQADAERAYQVIDATGVQVYSSDTDQENNALWRHLHLDDH